MSTEYQIIAPDEVKWTDAATSTNLPKGIRVAALSEHPGVGLRNVFAAFDPGYVEPRHTHGIGHATFLMEGRWIVEGKEIGPGSYMYGPSALPHGPFESPEGSVVYGSDVGTDFWHKHPPSEEDETKAVPTIIMDRLVVEWTQAPHYLGLDERIRAKAYHVQGRTDELTRWDGLLEVPAGVELVSQPSDLFRSFSVLEGEITVMEKSLGIRGHVSASKGTQLSGTTTGGATLCWTSVAL